MKFLSKTILFAQLVSLASSATAQNNAPMGPGQWGNNLPEAIPCSNSSALSAPRLSRAERLQEGKVMGEWPLLQDSSSRRLLDVEMGAAVQVVRCLSTGGWVVVGEGVVQNSSGGIVRAELTPSETSVTPFGKSTQREENSGNLYWRPMAGDSIIVVPVHVERRVRIAPIVILPVEKLFAASGQRIGYDISLRGEQILDEQIQKFASSSGRLLIEGFADVPGNREDLLADTRMRADSVARYLRLKHGITEDRLVVVGSGSSGLADSGMKAVGVRAGDNIQNGIRLKIISH